jgi:hypothetical protein
LIGSCTLSAASPGGSRGTKEVEALVAVAHGGNRSLSSPDEPYLAHRIALFADHYALGPLGMGQVIEVQTHATVDIPELARRINAMSKERPFPFSRE